MLMFFGKVEMFVLRSLPTENPFYNDNGPPSASFYSAIPAVFLSISSSLRIGQEGAHYDLPDALFSLRDLCNSADSSDRLANDWIPDPGFANS